MKERWKENEEEKKESEKERKRWIEYQKFR